MKTNQTLTRKMGDFDVHQRTSDGMFNATLLLKQWNIKSSQQKVIAHYFENESTKEFIKAIIEDSKSNIGIPMMAKNEVFTSKRGGNVQNSGTWMHPLLFIDFAMWLNPSFKVKVLKFVYDELVKYRNEAGDEYRQMCPSVSRIVDKPFTQMAIKKVAEAINYIVYNRHENLIRNKQADENLMRELVEIEKDITKLIESEFITSFEQLIVYLRKRWHKKWNDTPKCLSI